MKANESKSIYKITSITDKYAKGSISRAIAERLLGEIGLDDESVALNKNKAKK